MALRREHSKLRPQPPRLKDVHAQRRRERNGNQDARGRFLPGNTAPKGRKVKAIIRRYLGEGATSEQAAELTKDTLALFKALRRTTRNDAPQVQDTLARRARWGVLSAWYAMKAIDLGLGTEAGDAALEMAMKLDARAERLDVTALDLAARIPTEDDQPTTPWLVTTSPAKPPARAARPSPTPEDESAPTGQPDVTTAEQADHDREDTTE